MLKPLVFLVALLSGMDCSRLLGASSAADPGDGWIRLFDGSSRLGWVADAGNWQTVGGMLVSDPGKDSRIHTDTVFSDYDLHFEARITGGPTTLVLRVDPQSKPAQPGVRLSLLDGSLDEVHGSAGTAPTAGAWHRYELRADGKHLSASVDGAQTAQKDDVKDRVGWMQFEAPHGTRLEVREVWLQPLNLDRLYNGSNLDGWRSVAADAPDKKGGLHLPIPGLSSKPKPPKPVRWSGDGTMHGDGGEGELETTHAYSDFVARFAVQSNGNEKGAPTEFLFRGTANKFGSGYAVNTDLGASKAAPPGKEFGPGSIMSLERARVQAPGPGPFHVVTVVVRGRRFTVWIDGAELTDSYDTRPEGVYHVTAGPLAFLVPSERVLLQLRSVEAAALASGPEPPPAPTPISAPTGVPGAGAAPGAAALPAVMPIMPGQSPEEKARQEQVRSLTTHALDAASPEEAIRINKQILVLDPSDMPAQQRLDKAQLQVDAAEALRTHSFELHQASADKLEANDAHRDALLRQTQDALLHGSTSEARDRLNDAQRLGAQGEVVDHLQFVIHSRIRNRILLWTGVGCATLLGAVFGGVYLWRGRRQVLVAYLIALDGPDKDKRYLLNQEITHIGGVAMDGGKKNEIIVRDPDRLVSRFHCEVHKRKDIYYAIDLDSSNGTFLNRRRLQSGSPTRLRDGDRLILAGSSALRLHVERNRAK